MNTKVLAFMRFLCPSISPLASWNLRSVHYHFLNLRDFHIIFLVNDRAKEFSYLKHVSNYLQINYMWNITDNKIWYLIKNYRHLWHIYDVFFENFFESFSIKLSEKNIYFFSIYKFFTARSTTIFWTWEVFILSRVYKLFFTSH